MKRRMCKTIKNISRDKCVKAEHAIKIYLYTCCYVVRVPERVMYVLHLLLISHTTGDLGFRIY